MKGHIEGEEKVGREIQKAADVREDLNAKGLSEKAKTLRSSNIEIERATDNEIKNLEKET
jgi:hypothetical protein